MKKSLAFLLVLCMLLCTLLTVACGGETTEQSSEAASEAISAADTSSEAVSEQVSEPISESEESSAEERKTDMNAYTLWQDAYACDTFASPDNVYCAKYYYDGELITDYEKDASEGDAKIIFESDSSSRFINVADGYGLTLPSGEASGDFSLSEYRSKLYFANSVLTISVEDQNPYGNTESGWNTYFDEWLVRRINDSSFLSANNIMRTGSVVKSTELIDGYMVIQYNYYIKQPKACEYPYYNIAIVRPVDDYIHFYLLVMKSAEKSSDAFTEIVKSMTFFEKSGKSANHVGQYELKIPEYWNEETRNYYNKLINNDVPDWGFFYEGNSNEYIDWMASEEGIDYQSEIFMTYMHIGWYGSSPTLAYFSDSDHADLIARNAGGNGFNGKPVLNFTFQFTTTNNNIDGYSPMFDILRGKYDDYFRKLAQDIKEYGHPVILRLNNEMNTDWTSYCGMVTLLDPDIYIETWQRMYDIFLEEGVDNTIWVFNPVATTCPYCDWGEWLCYFPGIEYCQMLGLTNYEDANGTLTSFENRYKAVYKQYDGNFDNYPWMIGEFACGAGGSKKYDWGSSSYKDTVQGRSENSQASWVKAMFKCFANSTEEGYEFAHKIKAAVWFSCNDYVGIDSTYYIVNYYKLDEALDKTLAVFREWLPKIHEEDK